VTASCLGECRGRLCQAVYLLWSGGNGCAGEMLRACDAARVARASASEALTRWLAGIRGRGVDAVAGAVENVSEAASEGVSTPGSWYGCELGLWSRWRLS
jgi:hypothetical protein